jgi:hypothetical protein
VRGDLDERGPHAAGRAEHDDRLPPLHARAAVQHPPRGDAVDHDGLERDRVEPLGHRHEIGRVEHGAVGPAADLRERRDALPDPRAGAVARALDHADQVVAGHERERRLVVVLPAAHLFVPDAEEAVLAWARLHGFVSLEIGGNFASMRLDADALFERAL